MLCRWKRGLAGQCCDGVALEGSSFCPRHNDLLNGLAPVPNHPDCVRTTYGVVGPKERKWKIIIVQERSWPLQPWCWRYKRPGTRNYILIGPVYLYADPFPGIRLIEPC